MTDTSLTPPLLPRLWKRTDKALLALGATFAGVALLDPPGLPASIAFTFDALLKAAPFLLFAVLATAYAKASGAETLLSKAFEGRQARMIFFAALVGGVSPFCSCQVIPFIAAALGMGVPLAAVMAFWLSSPLMDPAMFIVTSQGLGLDFALAKVVAAVSVGLLGGFGVMALSGSALFDDPLRPRAAPSACATARLRGAPLWAFWREEPRRETFAKEARGNLWFLGKWMTLAYALESVMIAYVPAEWVASLLGGDGLRPIVMGALVGGPAYLNGYAAVPLLSGLIEQGMARGAAMSFMIAGGVSCIPAAVAVWALVKPRVFAAYIGFALIGALLAGMAFSLL